MFIITSLGITALYFLLVIFPLFAWLLPYFKIKKLLNSSLAERVLVELGAIGLIALVDYKMTIPYVCVFGMIDIFYIIFKKYLKNTEIFDKIGMISFILGSVVVVGVYLNRVEILEVLNTTLPQIKNLQTEYYEVIEYVSTNFIYLSYLYIMIIVFLFYYLVEKNSFLNWNVSYFWLIPYIILFFIKYYTNTTNIVVLNLIDCLKIIYILYFLQQITKRLNEFVKQRTLSLVASIFVTLLYPELSFIIGAIIRMVKKD